MQQHVHEPWCDPGLWVLGKAKGCGSWLMKCTELSPQRYHKPQLGWDTSVAGEAESIFLTLSHKPFPKVQVPLVWGVPQAAPNALFLPSTVSRAGNCNSKRKKVPQVARWVLPCLYCAFLNYGVAPLQALAPCPCTDVAEPGEKQSGALLKLLNFCVEAVSGSEALFRSKVLIQQKSLLPLAQKPAPASCCSCCFPHTHPPAILVSTLQCSARAQNFQFVGVFIY